MYYLFFFFKQKTAYEMRISDWSSDGCSSDLLREFGRRGGLAAQIKLARGPALEGLDDEARAQPGDLAALRLDLRGGPFVGFDVAREFLLDARAQHLDRDLAAVGGGRSEEHTSELQSLMRISYAVFCLKKKKATHPV